MRIDFLKDSYGYSVTDISDARFGNVAGMLQADVRLITGMEIVEDLRTAIRTGRPDEWSGNGYFVDVDGDHATVETNVTFSGMAPKVQMRTGDLLALVEAWLSYLKTGQPSHWDIDDSAVSTS